MTNVAHNYKDYKPPICPKNEKATGLRFDERRNSLLKAQNKNQRGQKSNKKTEEPSQLEANFTEFSKVTEDKPKQSDKHKKQELRQREYQQYSRKNYFKSQRSQEQLTYVQSNLTERVMTGMRSISREEEKRMKSKSALNYAKYFIKQISNMQTQPSSEEQPILTQQKEGSPQREVQKTEEKHNQKQIKSIFSHESNQKPNRTKLSERLKSLKNIRCKSNKKGCSIDKDARPSIQRPSVQSRQDRKNSQKKIAGNITSLSAQESNMIRMKARARNKRIILKVKQFNSACNLQQDDLCLQLSSKIDRSFTERKEVIQKIQLHLELLNLLPSYVKQFKQIYEEVQCWDQLVFLVYKKFYIQRQKILIALGDQINQQNKNVQGQNPFRFNFCQVKDRDLQEFKNTLESLKIQSRLSQQNKQIKNALRNLYNHIIQKSGRYINLYEADNFSEQIYILMREQVKLLQQNDNDSFQNIRLKRINFIIKCCLMIAFLNGQNVDIDTILTENDYNQKQLARFQQFMTSCSE